jgi:hypothetical protein
MWVTTIHRLASGLHWTLIEQPEQGDNSARKGTGPFRNISIIAVAAITVFEVIAGQDGTLAIAAFTSINTSVNPTMNRALTRGKISEIALLR